MQRKTTSNRLSPAAGAAADPGSMVAATTSPAATTAGCRRQRSLPIITSSLILMTMVILHGAFLNQVSAVALRSNGQRMASENQQHNVYYAMMMDEAELAADPNAGVMKAASFVKMPMGMRDNLQMRPFVPNPVMMGEDPYWMQENGTEANGLHRRQVNVATTIYRTVPSEYTATLSIGTPPQNFKVLYDTGSFYAWVKGTTCMDLSCLGTNTFDPTKSNTYSTANVASPQIAYVDGTSVTGLLCSDNIAISGVSLKNAAFVIGTTMTSNNPYGDHDFDGIIGMSLTPGTPPFRMPTPLFQQIMYAGAVPANQVGYTLFPDNKGGEVTFGGFDTSQFADPNAKLNWVNVATGLSGNNQYTTWGTWALPLQSISVTNANGQPAAGFSTLSYPQGTRGMMFDTGDSFTVLPQSLVNYIATAVGGTFSSNYGVYVVDSAKATQTGGPIVTVTLENGVQVHFTAQEYVLQAPLTSGLNGCLLALGATPDATTTFVCGNTVLKRWYTVFDYDNRRIGFAMAKGRSNPLAPANNPPPPPPPATTNTQQTQATTTTNNQPTTQTATTTTTTNGAGSPGTTTGATTTSATSTTPPPPPLITTTNAQGSTITLAVISTQPPQQQNGTNNNNNGSITAQAEVATISLTTLTKNGTTTVSTVTQGVGVATVVLPNNTATLSALASSSHSGAVGGGRGLGVAVWEVMALVMAFVLVWCA